jgi:hypothetical protein
MRLCLLAATLALLPATVLAQRPANPKQDSMVRTRIRVVGVFDRQTGEPLEGAEVRDFNSGLRSLTTRTGTVALLLDDTLGTLVHIRKVGYNPQTLMVGTALKDTIPLTVDLLRAGQLLETMIVTADGRSLRLGLTDTVQALIANGFYERRITSAAPSGAFITGDKLRATMMLSDARYFGRGICEDNLFVDGVRWVVPKREGLFSMEGIDAMLHPTDVAAIETYRFGDLPSSATHTYGGAGALAGGPSLSAVANGLNSMTVQGCVTLIWLKR